jgi:hypothetical protein
MKQYKMVPTSLIGTKAKAPTKEHFEWVSHVVAGHLTLQTFDAIRVVGVPLFLIGQHLIC